MNKVHSPEEIRKAALAFDDALENKDLPKVLEGLTDDCEIELLNVKVRGKEGAKQWFNWMYKHVATLKFLPITIMVDDNTYFEEYTVHATLHDGQKAQSKQTVVVAYENLKIKSLRMYFDRLDFADAVAKDVISKTIVEQLEKKSLEGLT